ncbi:molybdate ABC transporter substrate-binding protein [Reinekea marinisedimentorum]|uniref:Molybdate transport system substrate-binding protein n=1 Tax=Reinekea marinisedimentorum TaxID=230495 RepID=A0A4R3I694_9GAMM|nr:molybdate ABC transporter substrate-binding protein [Reinekea marinisedimentorum]TCS40313.1 molybdate transport system substrate-binding protein [Reinekea marinisedimentorum]
MKLFKQVLLAAVFMTSHLAMAGEVSVAVASNFYKPLLQLAEEFEQATGHKVAVSAGSTGALYAQIKNGAPFEVFLAADQARPEALEKEDKAIAGSRFTYAQGQLAYWSMQKGLEAEEDFKKSLAEVEHVAIANPKNAPYGAAAMDVMNELGVYQQAAEKLVEGNNIGQTYQYVSSKTVEAGFVALSQIYVDGRVAEGSAWLVPSSLHRVLNQDAILLTDTNDVARAFLDFLQSAPAKETIRSFGYKI